MLKFILLVIVGIVLLFGYTKYIEKRSIFFPSKFLEDTPTVLGLVFEKVICTTKDNTKISGWFIPAQNAKYTLLFFHGNAGNISHRLDKLKMLKEVGFNIYIIDYRGYGQSTGKPSECGLYNDAQAAYDYLVSIRKFSPDQIILYGESLGASVAIDLAKSHSVKALILEGAFSNIKDAAKKLYPYLPSWFISVGFDSLQKIKYVRAPVLFLHSRNDEIIPYDLAKKLYTAAVAPKQFIEFKGGHNSAFLDSQETYINSLRAFIESLKLQN